MKKFTALTTTFFTFILSAAPVAAQVDISISKPPNLKIDNPGKLLGGVIGLILIISALAAFIFLIWGGVQWITSGGDKAGVEAAQHRIQAALLGLFIVFAAWAIMLVAGQFLGFDLSNLKFPTPF
ncbi:hypothetical protein HY945_02705 [Candidatus Gottesmanbacteria bacterium]|nr:hypothetical protein [Candidatus Gottesmanbacteria bacterium]